jgi:hypothetical protein
MAFRNSERAKLPLSCALVFREGEAPAAPPHQPSRGPGPSPCRPAPPSVVRRPSSTLRAVLPARHSRVVADTESSEQKMAQTLEDTAAARSTR